MHGHLAIPRGKLPTRCLLDSARNISKARWALETDINPLVYVSRQVTDLSFHARSMLRRPAVPANLLRGLAGTAARYKTLRNNGLGLACASACHVVACSEMIRTTVSPESAAPPSAKVGNWRNAKIARTSSILLSRHP